MTKKWVTTFFLPLCLLAIRVPILLAQKATQPAPASSIKPENPIKSEKPAKPDKAEKKSPQPPQDETAHPRPEQRDADRSMWSRAKQGVSSVKTQVSTTIDKPNKYLEKKAQENKNIGDAKRRDRATRIDQLKDTIESKSTHPDDLKKAQADLNKLRSGRSLGERLEASALYRSGEREKIKTDARVKTPEERKERANEITEELKGPISRQRKWELETEHEALLKKPTLNERIAGSAPFQTAKSINTSLSNKITEHSTALKVGSGLLIGGGALAAGGALAVSMGGMAAAKKDALNPLVETMDPSTSAAQDPQEMTQPAEGLFIPSSFALPAE
jgi:hypothetical protein